jgi:hypothetical protein
MQCESTILLTMARAALPYFTTLPHKRHDFRGKVLEHKICVLICCTPFV